VRRGEGLAIGIDEEAGKQAGLLGPYAETMLVRIALELGWTSSQVARSISASC